MHPLLHTPQTPIDSKWFCKILPYTDELYITLGIPHEQLAALRASFESKPFNPDLRPIHLDPDDYRQRNDALRVLLQQILVQEPNSTVRQAYGLKIEELITQNDLVVAAVNNDTDALRQQNRWLYGTAEQSAFSGVCAWIRQTANEYFHSAIPHIAKAALDTLEHLPNIDGNTHTILPDDHLFKRVRDAHFESGGFIAQLFDNAVIPDIVSPETGDPLTQAAIKAVGSQYGLRDSMDSLWGVIHSEHSVVRPAGYSLQRPEFMGIVSHEIGSHLLERENGLRQPLQLLSVGLDRYEASNEGRAFLREQIMYRTPYELLGESAWEHIVLLYLSSGLASGTYQQPYDFVSLYRVILPVCMLLKARHLPDNPVLADVQARDEAWQICTRAAKGTSGQGGAFNKGLVYLNGNIAAWQMAAKNPDYIFFGDAGKFDISRPDHQQILADFDITLQDYPKPT